MQEAFVFLGAIVVLFIIVKVFSWPLKVFIKLLINGILGAVLLFIVNLVGKQFFNFSIGINIVTALVAGFCGIPGVIFLILFKLIL